MSSKGRVRTPINLPTDQPTRRALFDRVRGVLAIGIVAGHALLVVNAPPGPIDALNDAARIVRMPAFFLISGALLTYRPLWNQTIAVLMRLGPLYLAGIALHALVALFFYRQLQVQFLPPVWGLWFLLALGLLRVTLSLFQQRGIAVPFAVAAAIVASVIELPQSSWLTRAMMLAPFFTVGAWLGANRLEQLAERLGLMRSIMLLGTCVFVIGLMVALTPLTSAALQWRQPHTANGLSPLLSACVSIAILSAGLGASFGTFGIIARVRGVHWLEFFGKRSFVILIGHFAIFDALRASWRPMLDGEAALLSAIVALTVAGTVVPIATLWLINQIQRRIRLRPRHDSTRN